MYESKDVQPPADVLKLLSEILDVSIDYLFNGNQSEELQALLPAL